MMVGVLISGGQFVGGHRQNQWQNQKHQTS
jgi:hypothetical protein